MAARYWTPEQRQQQAQRIRQSRPWEHSTGPRSAAGKQVASRNAYRGGLRPQLRSFSRSLAELAGWQQQASNAALTA